MKVVIRADASLVIGQGHIMRCLSLAEALRSYGAVVRFVCRVHDGHLCDLIEKKGFPVDRLPASVKAKRLDTINSYEDWLGLSWEEDAEQTLLSIISQGEKVDWLIVDHYALDHQWETRLRHATAQIIVIDDLANRLHDCDLLLDQNLVQEMDSRYVGKVPAACNLLLGPKYALLQPLYAKLHKRIPARSGKIKRVLIFFSSFDLHNFTSITLSALLSLSRTDIEVDVVLGEKSPHYASVFHQINQCSNIRLYNDLPTLAPLMAKADIAIGAGGSTSWERLCLGLPSIVITLADNQKDIASGLSHEGLILWLGSQKEVSEQTIATALNDLFKQDLDPRWSLKCLETVDGLGINRVCAVMLYNEKKELYLRQVIPSDEGRLVDVITQNDQAYGSMFHHFLRKIDEYSLYIAEIEEGVLLGKAEFWNDNGIWKFSCSVLSIFSQKNLNELLQNKALLKFRSEHDGLLVFGSSKGSQNQLISICSDKASWINDFIPELVMSWLESGYQVAWTHAASTLPQGDFCFYLGYGQIVNSEILKRYKNNLVVHESDLPKGRGWSPLTWQVLEGAKSFMVTLIEAEKEVDSGVIYLQEKVDLKGTELVDDLRRLQKEATFRLCRSFVSDYTNILNNKRQQTGEPSYYKRRFPVDAQLDPDKSLRDQFNLLRVSDNYRYPARVKIDGVEYRLKIDKL